MIDEPILRPTADNILNEQLSALRLEEFLEEKAIELGMGENHHQAYKTEIENDLTEKERAEKAVKKKAVEEKEEHRDNLLLSGEKKPERADHKAVGSSYAW